MKKEILFVVDEQMYGGISVVLTTILKKLDYKNINVDVLILHNRGNAIEKESLPKEVNIIYGSKFFSSIDYTISSAIKSKNIRIIYHKIQTVLGLKTGLIKNRIKKERKKILKKKYDIEIAFKDGFCALFTACGDSTKKINWLHTSYDICDNTGKYRKLFVEVYEKIDQIVAITEGAAESFNKIYHLENKTQIIENLVDDQEIIRKSKIENIEFEQDKLNLISVGRVASAKAYPRLLEQFAKLKKEGKAENVVLRIVGDGDEMPIVQQMIKENQLEEQVKLLGYLENPYPYVVKSDMLVLASIYEGLGMVLLEAILLGIPCFSTKVSSVEKTLNDGNFGMIVENSEQGIYEGNRRAGKRKRNIKRCLDRSY